MSTRYPILNIIIDVTRYYNIVNTCCLNRYMVNDEKWLVINMYKEPKLLMLHL